MDKTVAGLIGAVAALSAAPSQAASPAPQSIEAAMQAASYADLLKPIPNARQLLDSSQGEAGVQTVQLVVVQPHHHHYHHRRHHYHHHHHHHSQD